MSTETNLGALLPGQCACITGIRAEENSRRRLRELGFNDGAKVECVLKRSGISAFLVKGTVIALRNEDSGGVAAEMPMQAECIAKRSCSACR